MWFRLLLNHKCKSEYLPPKNKKGIHQEKLGVFKENAHFLINLKSATYRVSWNFACKKTKILLLYIFLGHNRNVINTKSPYPIKRLEVIRWFNQKSMVFNQSLSWTGWHKHSCLSKCSIHSCVMSYSISQEQRWTWKQRSWFCWWRTIQIHGFSISAW